jgi:hypothetical protein
MRLEESGVGKAYPLSGEKLALVLTVYRASDFKAAKERDEIAVELALDPEPLDHALALLRRAEISAGPLQRGDSRIVDRTYRRKPTRKASSSWRKAGSARPIRSRARSSPSC